MLARVFIPTLLATVGFGVLLAVLAMRTPEGERADGPQAVPGFRVELVYSPSLAKEGSWVSLTIDSKGRLIASDQYGLLYRVTPSPLGGQPDQTQCEPIRIGAGAAQGLAFVNDALYVMVNSQEPALASGLYRLADSDGDDKFDDVRQLIRIEGSGEHGPHAVVASPDGKSLYLSAGNYTRSPRFKTSRVPAGWGEDQLLPRLDDPAAQATGVPAPGGWVVKCDLDGDNCELVSVGYRNIYDLAFNTDGELFTSDSDLDVDIGTPWYRPPSLLHVTSGADYGWRGGNGIWPTYYQDTLPPVAVMPPGSPAGIVAGIGTDFPEPYRDSIFIADWSRGAIYSAALEANGSSYRGECEPIAWDVGGVTDLVVRPQDGALYFTVGGRQIQSGLYRLVWDGDEKQASAERGKTIGDAATSAGERSERQKLEELHSDLAENAIESIWPALASPDRFVRYAAMTALERTDSKGWQSRGYSEPNVHARCAALTALARRSQPAYASKWVDSLLELPFTTLSAEEQLEVLRTISLGVTRFTNLDDTQRHRIATAATEWLPSPRPQANAELAKLLVRLKSPAIIEPLLNELAEKPNSEQAIQAAVQLSVASAGWTPEGRAKLLDWFDSAANTFGQRAFYPYLEAARGRFIGGFRSEDRTALASRLAPPKVAEKAATDQQERKFTKHWTTDEVVAAVGASDETEHDADALRVRGRQLFTAIGCADCHAMRGEGASVGPDLTNVGRRYSVRDLARATTQPDDEIPDLYRQTTFVVNGRTITGRPTNMTATTISVTTDMRDPASAVKLQRQEIESETACAVSAMPSNLLDTLTSEDVIALFAYLGAGANQLSDGAQAPPNQ
jgi:putative heme-binding domain-containing protein